MSDDDRIPTRASLLNRLKDPDDSASWNEFYRMYRDLIYSVARRASLSEQEADEVVQDTLISVARKMPGFTYDASKDSFKGWLLTLTWWRIKDQLERRARLAKRDQLHSPRAAEEQGTRTATIERVPDPAGERLTAVWEEEWDKHLLQIALARIKRQAHPQQYQIYHLHVILGQAPREVAHALNVSTAHVYLAKHRVGSLIKKEIRTLRKTLT